MRIEALFSMFALTYIARYLTGTTRNQGERLLESSSVGAISVTGSVSALRAEKVICQGK